MASVDDVTVDGDVVAQLEHGAFGSKQCGPTREEQRSREVDEGGPAVRDPVEAEVEHGIGQESRAGKVAVVSS